MSTKEVNTSEELQAELEKMLADLGPLAIQAAEQAMQRALMYLYERIPEYPEKPTQGGWLAQMTPKARRWFFWAVKNGKVDGWQWKDGHPEGSYRRRQSGGVGGHFTYDTKINSQEGTLTGEIGTNLEYAPWVIGPQFPGYEINGQVMFQAKIHEGRWWRFPDVMEQNMDMAWQEFDREFYAQLEDAFSKAA